MTCSTQYIDSVQRTIATTLGIKESTINMSVRRLGGAFGGKVQKVLIGDRTPFFTNRSAQRITFSTCTFSSKFIRFYYSLKPQISNASVPAAACAVAAFKLGKPVSFIVLWKAYSMSQVRIVLDLESNLEAVGKRLPYLAKYKASVDKDKKLTGVNIKIFCDSGANYNESTADIAVGFAKSVYVRFLMKF